VHQKEINMKKEERKFIPFAIPNCGDDEIREVADAIKMQQVYHSFSMRRV